MCMKDPPHRKKTLVSRRKIKRKKMSQDMPLKIKGCTVMKWYIVDISHGRKETIENDKKN